MRVILAEKPDMGRKIADALGVKRKGNGYIELMNGDLVTWAIGHIIKLREPEHYPMFQEWKLSNLPVIPERMASYIDEDKKDQFNIIKRCLEQSTGCVIATDPAREGEHIARTILAAARYDKPLKRLWISDLTEATIRKGMSELLDGSKFDNLASAARLRSYADWWIGFTATRLFSLTVREKTGQNVLLSAGRVKTPTLKLVYDREMQIVNFKAEHSYSLKLQLQSGQATYEGRYILDPQDPKPLIFKDKKEVETLIPRIPKEGHIVSVQSSQKKKSPPLLLDSTSIKSYARKELGFSIKKTDQIIQRLYDDGYTSYPRTDSEHLTENSAKELYHVLQSLKDENSIYRSWLPESFESLLGNSRYVDNAKAVEHHAIIPTGKLLPQDRDKDDRAVYDIIMRVTIAAHYPPAIDLETNVITALGEHCFLTKQVKILDPGYRALLQDEENEQPDPETSHVVLEEGKPSVQRNAAVQTHETTKPKRYNEDELVKTMRDVGRSQKNDVLKEIGIGTAATRAVIVQELIRNQYLDSKKNILHITPKGLAFMEMVKDHNIASIELSAQFETTLDQVAKGEVNFTEAEQLFKDFVHQMVQDKEDFMNRMPADVSFSNKEVIGSCPSCQNDIIVYPKHYGCEGYKEGCKFGISKSFRGVNITAAAVKNLLTGKALLLKNIVKEEKTYDLVLSIEDGQLKTAFPTTEDLKIADCCKCGSAVIEKTKVYACSNCNLIIYKEMLGASISRSNASKIAQGKQSSMIKNFSGNYGQFDAALKYDTMQNKIVFIRPKK